MEAIDDLKAVAERLSVLVAGTRPEQLSAPTPCSEWDVRALLNHVVRGTLTYTATALGEAEPDRSADYLGDDPAAAFRLAYSGFLDTMSKPGALEVTYQNRRGPVSGERLVQTRSLEYLVHGWDLAQATGQVPDLPEDLVATCIALNEEMERERPREPQGAYAPARPLQVGATTLEQLAAHFGRTPSHPASAGGHP